MGDANVVRPRARISREQLWIGGALAIVIYIVMDQLDGFIALPMREASSRISAFILNALSIKTVRTGTILSTDNFTFDVVPACSGSTTLRVLLTLGVIWCAIHPQLTLTRRIVCAALVAPIALFANGVRVAALVGLGDVFLKPVEGVPHTLVGLSGFALAMSTVYLMTEVMTTQEATAPTRVPVTLVLLVISIAILYAPIIVWILDSWMSGPLEFVGLAFILAAAGSIACLWRKSPGGNPRPWLACGLFGLSIFALARAIVLDVRTVESWCLLLSLYSLILLFKGGRFALGSAPLLLVAYLGFPQVGNFISVIVAKTVGIERPVFALLVKFVVAGVLLALAWLRLSRPVESGSPRGGIGRTPLNVVTFLAAVGVLFQTHFNSKAASFDREGHIELSYVQGDWIGTDSQISEVAIEQIGRERIVSRRYASKGRYLNLIVTTTGADRRRAHPPEWCMTGTGWTVQNRELTTKRLKGEEVPMTRVFFRKGDSDVEFYYWFSDGHRNYATHNEMMREDLVRRLKGVRTNWMLIRLLAPKGNDYLDEFMGSLEPTVAKLTTEAKPAGNL